jgi:hypothetical protein
MRVQSWNDLKPMSSSSAAMSAYDAGIGEQFAKLVERLDPPVPS